MNMDLKENLRHRMLKSYLRAIVTNILTACLNILIRLDTEMYLNSIYITLTSDKYPFLIQLGLTSKKIVQPDIYSRTCINSILSRFQF